MQLNFGINKLNKLNNYKLVLYLEIYVYKYPNYFNIENWEMNTTHHNKIYFNLKSPKLKLNTV